MWLTEFLVAQALEAAGCRRSLIFVADSARIGANVVLSGSPSFRTVRCSPSLTPPLERFVPNAHVADDVNSQTPTKIPASTIQRSKILRLLKIVASYLLHHNKLRA